MYLGQVLDEGHATGDAADRTQLLASATKGYTGLVGAMAAADGQFTLDEPVAPRALKGRQMGAQKSRITYRHVLSMTSGLEELKGATAWIDHLSATTSPGSRGKSSRSSTTRGRPTTSSWPLAPSGSGST